MVSTHIGHPGPSGMELRARSRLDMALGERGAAPWARNETTIVSDMGNAGEKWPTLSESE